MEPPRSEAAFLQLFDEHHTALYRFAYRLTGSAADAEEIVQECFLGLLRPTCSYDPARAPIRTYLFGVVRNQSLKRRRQTDIPEEPATRHQSPESEFLRAELKDVVAHAVMQLPDTQREVLILAHYEQMPLGEIAQVMDLELGAVKSRLQRARASLKETLAAWAPAPPSLRERVRAGFPVRPKWTVRWRKSLVAAAVFAAVAFFLIATQASPQPTAPIPWTVDSEFIRYGDNGSPSIEMYSTSYESNSNEILLSRSTPGNPFRTALVWAADVVMPIHNRLMGRIMLDPKLSEQRQRALARSVGFITGCDPNTCLLLGHSFYAKAPAGAGNGCVDGEIVARETILNYPTEAVRERWTEHGRMTIWTAPALGCFALKVTQEVERPDGTFRLVAAKQALKVTINP